MLHRTTRVATLHPYHPLPRALATVLPLPTVPVAQMPQDLVAINPHPPLDLAVEVPVAEEIQATVIMVNNNLAHPHHTIDYMVALVAVLHIVHLIS